MQFTTLFMAIMPALIAAAPTSIEGRDVSGKATWYNTYYPTYSSCGDQPHDTDMIAALSASYMPSDCGKKIRVTNTASGATVDVTVVDTCVACSGGAVAVDLSPSAFSAIGNQDAGTVPVTWTYI